MVKNVGLICEGGGTKAAYSAGVLQCLLDHEVYLPYTAGISAGAEILLAYVSRQRERLFVTGVESASQKSAVGIRPLFLLTRPYQFRGHQYMDAGLIDMIPIEQSIRRGNKKHIFISTKEENYVRKPAPNWQLRAAGLFYPGNKEVKENLRKRHIRYEEQWGKVKQLEEEGKALILRPHKDLGITRYTTDRKLLEPWFQLGYDETEERMDEIRAFIREE